VAARYSGMLMTIYQMVSAFVSGVVNVGALTSVSTSAATTMAQAGESLSIITVEVIDRGGSDKEYDEENTV